ncbi:MAG: DUF1648 domain-containing protein [Candidatus Nezhaarchaeales archaeon]
MERIEPVPLGRRGVALALLIVLELAAIWALAIYFYLDLPQVVPVHFGPSGEPTRYGEKLELLGVPVAMSIAPTIILLVTKYRFALVNRYSYLVNLPAFFVRIARVPRERRGLWVNRYFEALLALGAALTALLLALECVVYLSAFYGRADPWMVAAAALMILCPLAPFVLYLRRMAREMALEAGPA